MSTQQRRSYGTGRIEERTDSAGRVSYYGQWRTDGRRMTRRIGLKRRPGTRDGLTMVQAETKLRQLMAEVKPSVAVDERLDLREAGERYVAHLERLGRKRTTIMAVESVLRTRLVPFFDGKALESITHKDVDDLLAVMEDDGLTAKSIRNYIGTLSAIFTYAANPRRNWVARNPCDGAELPGVAKDDNIRFLRPDEVAALLAGVPGGDYQAVEHALYVTATRTGLRQGELQALRWRDIDWQGRQVRVERSYDPRHGGDGFSTPKSQLSRRTLPMIDEVAGELDRLFKVSPGQRDHDLVFADPIAREPQSKAAILRRFKRAIKAAGLDDTFRFHDLRHTFGTSCAAAGVNLLTLQTWMGHEDIKTTRRYLHYSPAHEHELALLGKAFAAKTQDDVEAAVI